MKMYEVGFPTDRVAREVRWKQHIVASHHLRFPCGARSHEITRCNLHMGAQRPRWIITKANFDANPVNFGVSILNNHMFTVSYSDILLWIAPYCRGYDLCKTCCLKIFYIGPAHQQQLFSNDRPVVEFFALFHGWSCPSRACQCRWEVHQYSFEIRDAIPQSYSR